MQPWKTIMVCNVLSLLSNGLLPKGLSFCWKYFPATQYSYSRSSQHNCIINQIKPIHWYWCEKLWDERAKKEIAITDFFRLNEGTYLCIRGWKGTDVQRYSS